MSIILFRQYFKWTILMVQFAISSLTLASSLSQIENQNSFKLSVKSMKTLRDQNVVKQGFDYSCGAGALATLLRFGIGDKVNEKEIMMQLTQNLPKDQEILKKKQGFSLLDLQNVTRARGYKSAGFKLAPQFLTKLDAPVIVFIEPRGYKHFAVLKGIRGDRVYLADPSLGNIRMPAYEFLNMWLDKSGKGVIFVVEEKNGEWPSDYPLKLKSDGVSQTEILSVRQLINIGPSSAYSIK